MRILPHLVLSVTCLCGAVSLGSVPDPTDPSTCATSTNSVPSEPHPPTTRPPVMPYKGNIYALSTNSITFYNDHGTNSEPLEIWWTDNLVDSNSWVCVGTGTSEFVHNYPSGFYGVNVEGLKFIEVEQ